MYWIDIAIIVVIVISLIVAIVRGFMKEAIALATWIIAFIVSLNFAQNLAHVLPDFVSAPLFRQGLAWFLLFAGVMCVGGLINFLVNSLIDRTGLSGTNRALGAVFGVIRGGLIICALVLLGNFLEMQKTIWWKKAKLLPYFEQATKTGLSMLPEDSAQKFDFSDREGDAFDGSQPKKDNHQNNDITAQPLPDLEDIYDNEQNNSN